MMRKQKHVELIEEALEQQSTAEAQLAEIQSRRPDVENIVYHLSARRNPTPIQFQPRLVGERWN